MAWFSRFTRFGDMHLVYGQERGMSCGPSSVAMCVAKLNKFSMSEAFISESRVRALYASLNKTSSDFIFKGSGGAGLARALNSLNCGNWVSTDTTSAAAAALIRDKVGVTSGFGPVISVEPVLVGVWWGGNAGGHAVVVDTVREAGGKLYATVCDPWDANVHVQEFNAAGFEYRPKREQGVDGPGESEHIRLRGGVVTSQQRKHFDYKTGGSSGSAIVVVHRTA